MTGRMKTLGAGLLAGLVAALLMTLVMAVLRYSLGVASTFEMIGDRFAPLIPVGPFLELQAKLGGYNAMKQLGVSSAIVGQLVVGSLGGAAYAIIVGRAGRSEVEGRRFGRPGVTFVAGAVGIAWLAILALLWPVLDTNFRGLPPGTARAVTALGLLFSFAVFGTVLILTYRYMTGRAPTGRVVESGTPRVGRRAFLAGGAGVVLALASGELFRRLFNQATFSYDGLRAGVEGKLVRAITPNDEFYVVTKNVVDPRVSRAAWRFSINGMVDNPRTYGFDEIAALRSVDQETTLSCISNPVGGRLMSNAMWRGVPLRDLLEDAKPQDGVVEVVLRGADGYTDTFAFEKAMDPTTLVAYEMNGEPLPDRHGFPARIIVPGLYGEKNVKWVTGLELVDHDAKGFYETQGWGPNFVQPTRSRFDAPDFTRPFPVGEAIALSGTAYAGDRGVEGVEVSTDGGGSWQKARLTYRGNRLSWSLWGYDWTPEEPGEYALVVRATDGDGELQTSEFRPARSGKGATGLHSVTARVEA